MKTEDFKNKFDLSIRRRRYYSEDCGLSSCPECGLPLIEDSCTVILAAESETDEGEYMCNMTGSHFCESCPVVVFDSDKVEQAARLIIKGGTNLRYLIGGIVNFNAIPKEKRHLEIGIEGNPVPLVHFLPDLNKTTIKNDMKIGRNEPCPCGSGKKYKKCCG